MSKNIANQSPIQVIGRVYESVRRLLEAGLSFEALQIPITDVVAREEIIKKWMSFLPKEEVIRASFQSWLQEILENEKKYHKAFFGQTFPLSQFVETLKKYGREQVEKWGSMGMEPHFLPQMVLSQDSTLPGWKIKPEQWFWDQVKKGKLFRMINGIFTKDEKADHLEGVTVLIDTRLKPSYGNEYQDDYLASIIQKLRQDKKIENYNFQSSRFDISSNEFKIMKPFIAEALHLQPHQIRMERVLEANIIPQLYIHMLRKNDGTTNTWEWREEYFEDRDDRLRSGYSDDGGLADVYYGSVGYLWHNMATRPLAVL